jgi:transcriptional regulator with GAF, ATPase, and Fis domain
MEIPAAQDIQSSPREQESLLSSLLEIQREKNLLLSLADDIALIRSKDDLLALINGRLKELLPFHHSGVGLINADGTYSALLIDSSEINMSPKEQETYLKGGYPINNVVFEVMKSNEPVVFDLGELVARGDAPLLTQRNYEAGMKEMVIVALRREDKNIGFFGLFEQNKNHFSKNYLSILKSLSNQISIAVANILANEEIIVRENEKTMLLTLSNDISACRKYEDVQNILSTKLRKYFRNSEITFCLNNPDNLTHHCYAAIMHDETIKHPDLARGLAMKYFINDGIFNVAQESTEPVSFQLEKLMTRENRPWYVDFWYENNVREFTCFPIRMNNEAIGCAFVYLKGNNSFSDEELRLAQAVCTFIGIALSNIRSYDKIESQLKEIEHFKSQLEQEKAYLQEQINTSYNSEEIIGANNGLRNVFNLVSNVAPTDTTVLILGETGTGKELIATAIHNASPRRKKLMIKLNCAALPSHLVESELFGHEKGSFTGAVDRRIGKFELANGGTLFLDEIGEMSLELQSKLLRAIQEKEIERIGGNGVIKTDVRIIAASNRNLSKEVEAGKFRTDLFYRLNVFPILLPPLRERIEDIPMLVSFFIKKFAQKTGSKPKSISPKVVQELSRYHWPGNVRELEHMIERGLLMTTGEIIADVGLMHKEKDGTAFFTEGQPKSLEDNEREYILSVLKKTNGRVRGEDGAASILKIPPTTLHSKMKKLGIKKAGS